MYYRNRFDLSGECSVRGENAEILLGKMLSKRGKVRAASITEQYNHFDWILNELLKYEGKGRKKLRRSDAEPNDNYIWVELTNIRGKSGWLYGHADKIAFEQLKSFIIVDRLKLIRLVELKCKPYLLVESAEKALYRGWTRPGNKDLMTLVLTSDVIEIADEIIIKETPSPCVST